jgi:hypothetical protein
MENKIKLIGKIGFEPENITKKHNLQASWKHIAMVFFSGDVTEYYAWFIEKRYNLKLNKPLRGAHISFINDSFREMSSNGEKSIDDVKKNWEMVKKKWNNQKVEISLSLEPKTDDKHWWLNVPQEDRDGLHGIRAELGLSRPFFGLHMTIGYANEKWLPHSCYIHSCIKSGLIN